MARAADTKGVAWEVPDKVMPAASMLAPGARIVSNSALQPARQQTTANEFGPPLRILARIKIWSWLQPTPKTLQRWSTAQWSRMTQRRDYPTCVQANASYDRRTEPVLR